MPKLGRPLVSAALAASMLLAACGGGGTIEGLPTALPTNLPSIPTEVPTGLPSGLGVNLTEGTARVELSGGVTQAIDVPLVTPSVFNPPPGGASLSYADSAGNAIGIGGLFQTSKTSATLVLTITVTQPEITLFISQAGECTLTFAKADATGVQGSFECADLQGSEAGPTDATGTFEGSV